MLKWKQPEWQSRLQQIGNRCVAHKHIDSVCLVILTARGGRQRFYTTGFFFFFLNAFLPPTRCKHSLNSGFHISTTKKIILLCCCMCCVMLTQTCLTHTYRKWEQADKLAWEQLQIRKHRWIHFWKIIMYLLWVYVWKSQLFKPPPFLKYKPYFHCVHLHSLCCQVSNASAH